ncbi:MAG: hypothetical protein BEU03_00565 [Marine Group III euryarchaeote CG-Epi6]|uniref:Transmembrane protein n=1 Tax=Marine Group III euryarchaeote CG-Epi6 TaxID=1889000 RepID=A0A1J5SRT8_9ARCH|nr:MAG: hypothetical protein BEU03_00565 [Marine Group III euryarchaeote CG-Epi6]
MARNQRKRGRRPARKSKKKGLSFGSLAVQLISILVILFLVFFLIAAKIISNITGALLCMVCLSILAYFIINSPKKPKRKRRSKKRPSSDEPQFYTALPSTVGLTEVPEEFSTSEVKLPPRPAKSVRRQREFVMYPPSVGSGDYSDSYTQIDKDTVLRLRGEMIPEMGTKFLPGSRLSSLPSANEIAELLENVGSTTLAAEPVAVAAEPVAVAAEPVAVAAEPVAVAAEPVAVAAEPATTIPTKVSEDESEDMDFDMEWD